MDLTQATLTRLDPKIAVPAYDRSRLRGGIVHIGVGNFHRVHQAVYVDGCLHQPGNEGWGIVGIGLMDGAAARAKAAAFHAQDCLYSVTAFAPDGTGQVRVIGAMIDYLHAPSDPEAALARLAHPDTRIVTLTITEGGYNLDEATGRFMAETPDVAADLGGGLPRTVFGYLVEALRRRRKAGRPAFTIASCDNLRNSGDTARAAILGFAEARDPDLATWIAAEVDFPNGMVDRLAPQVPEAQRLALNAASGIDDCLPVPTETFTQWVIEDRFRHGRPPLETAGVEFRDNVGEWLAFKGRMINATHVLISYPALLMGYRIVADALTDPLIVQLAETFLHADAKPNVRGPSGVSVDDYAAKFVPRFRNPAIVDQLLRVAGDGAAKLPTFHGQTLRMLIDADADLRREAFLLACFARYLAFAIDETLRDDRGTTFALFEPGLGPADLEALRTAGPAAILRIRAFQGLGLADHARFRILFDRYGRELAKLGARATLAGMLGPAS